MVLDDHPGRAVVPAAGVTGLDELARIAQTVGVLVARGHTVESATAELVARAEQAGTGTAAVADRVLATLTGRRDLT